MSIASTMGPAGPTFWEDVSATRWGSYITRSELRVILQAQKLAGPPSAAMEVGCDGGRWSKQLADIGWQMTCTDVNPVTLEKCRRTVPTANCVLVSPESASLPCAAASQAFMLCVEVAPVIGSNWFFGEARRGLANQGILMGVFWNRASVRGLGVNVKAKLCGRVDTFYRHPYSWFRHQLRTNGFTLLLEEGICWAPFGRASNSPLIPTFTWLEQRLGLARLPSASPWVMFIAQKDPMPRAPEGH
jgi:Methyltransferase domain